MMLALRIGQWILTGIGLGEIMDFFDGDDKEKAIAFGFSYVAFFGFIIVILLFGGFYVYFKNTKFKR